VRLRSTECRSNLVVDDVCVLCRQLKKNSLIIRMEGRAQNGCSETTPRTHFTIGQLNTRIDKQNETLNKLKLRSLNTTRAIGKFARAVDEHKRFMMAVASGSYNQVQALVARGLRSGWSVGAIVDKMDSAAKGFYKGRSRRIGSMGICFHSSFRIAYYH
jgi:hypothetical protein